MSRRIPVYFDPSYVDPLEKAQAKYEDSEKGKAARKRARDKHRQTSKGREEQKLYYLRRKTKVAISTAYKAWQVLNPDHSAGDFIDELECVGGDPLPMPETEIPKELLDKLAKDPKYLQKVIASEELHSFKSEFSVSHSSGLRCPACNQFGQTGGSLWGPEEGTTDKFVCRKCRIVWIIKPLNKALATILREIKQK